MAATGTLADNESGRMQGAITKPPLRGLITSAEAQGPGKPSDVSEHARLLSVWASFRQEHADVEVQGTQSNSSGVLQGAPDHGTATDLCGAETDPPDVHDWSSVPIKPEGRTIEARYDVE